MKVRLSLLAATLAAAGTYAVSYASRPSGSATATLVGEVFLAVFVAGLVLSAAASGADRRRAARRSTLAWNDEVVTRAQWDSLFSVPGHRGDAIRLAEERLRYLESRERRTW
jgi:hypothetical protein